MSKSRSTVTIAIHWKGDPESQIYTMPAWLFKTLAVGSVVFAALVALVAVLYTPIARTAARVPGLNTEIARLTEENSQVQQLAATLQELEARYDQIRTVLGAEIIAIPCNTAHYFWREVQDSVPIPVLNIISETVARIAEQLDAGSKVGVLATQATADHGLYQRSLRALGLEGIAPDPAHQVRVTKAIACIKQNRDRQAAAYFLEPCLTHLQARGIQVVIFGCTELGLAPVRTDLLIFDSLEILARATVEMGRGRAIPAKTRTPSMKQAIR